MDIDGFFLCLFAAHIIASDSFFLNRKSRLNMLLCLAVQLNHMKMFLWENQHTWTDSKYVHVKVLNFLLIAANHKRSLWNCVPFLLQPQQMIIIQNSPLFRLILVQMTIFNNRCEFNRFQCVSLWLCLLIEVSMCLSYTGRHAFLPKLKAISICWRWLCTNLIKNYVNEEDCFLACEWSIVLWPCQNNIQLRSGFKLAKKSEASKNPDARKECNWKVSEF